MTRLRRWWWLLLLIPIVIGATRLRLDVEVLNLLPPNLPSVQGLKIYQENFSNARELIVTLEGPDANQLESTARDLAHALRRQTNLAAHVTWQPAWLEFPGQSAELIAYLWLNEPPPAFATLTNRLVGPNLTNALLDAQQRLATSSRDRKSTRLNSSHLGISYAVFCLKKKKTRHMIKCKLDR